MGRSLKYEIPGDDPRVSAQEIASAGFDALSAGLEAGTPGVQADSSGSAAAAPRERRSVRRVILRSVGFDVIPIASLR